MIIWNRDELIKIVKELKKENKKIVFTNGCFDILHEGHVKMLEEAKKLGNVLMVGINSDKSIRRIKGSKRPINPLRSRIKVLDAIRYVDYVVPFDEETPEKLIEIIKPHIHVKGSDYKYKPMPEKDLVEKFGGKIVLINLVPNVSTTEIVNRILRLYGDKDE